MNGINARVGARIRLYRRAKKLTLIQLSAMIHKSKATLSKYETGDIAIDVETLYDIAAALDIRIEQLLDQRTFTHGEAHGESCAFFQQSRIYVYFYDGRIGRCVKNVLQLDRATEPCTAVFYLDVPSFDDDALSSCRSLYYGTAEYFDAVTNFSLDNQTNRMEHASLCAVNPIDRVEQVQGMLTGISRYPMLPVSLKCILSPVPLMIDDALMEKLILSRWDMKLIRRLNMFAVEQ